MSPARKRLPAEERHARILRDLKINPALRVAHLAKAFGVTTETIRRDLDALSADGRLARTYGGAAAARDAREPAFHERQNRLVEERSRIGARAAALIKPGDVLMIDSGSTTLHFARHLASLSSNLTVITNSPAIAATLAMNGTMKVLLCPGEYDPREGGVFGSHTIEFLQRLRADRVVLGASGLAEEGPSEARSEAAVVKRAMMASSKQRTLLIDATKYNRIHIEIICALREIGEIVTDRKPSFYIAEALRKSGVRLHLAPAKR
jgi:DeoR/GlpR family transcriptional regulator of sugar metabolism